MPELKEIALYGILAIIVVAIIFYAITQGLFSSILGPSTYSVLVTLAQVGHNSTYPYQTSHYIINVTNTGHNQINNLLVGFYLNGEQQSSNTVSLPPGKSITYLRNYTYPNPGIYQVQAIADPGQLVNLTNRSRAQQTIITNISEPQIPNVYGSIPNSNITDTQSFKLSGYGGLSVGAIAQNYNISSVRQLFGPDTKLSTKIFENGYAYTANIYGAYALYSNNAVAYTAWMDGTITPQVINYIITSFGANVETLSSNSNTSDIGFTKINKNTSICTFYSEGWTKMISYFNNSLPGNCVTIASSTYTPSESNVLIDQLETSNELVHLQSGLFYINSTISGSTLSYTNNSIAATNIFQNDFGLFIGTIRKLAVPRPANVFANNSICYGLISDNASGNVCSYLLPTVTGNYELPYGVVNSTLLTKNFSINMYSLVNNTQLIAAHDNAAHLMDLLKVNESSIQWESNFHNGCSFANTSIGCIYKNLSHPNNTVTLNLTNHYNSTVRIDKLNCEIVPGFANVTINRTIAPGAQLAIAQHCQIIAIPSVAAQTSYTLILTYTLNNKTSTVTGFLNVSNGQSLG
jgi:hypothetical protein